MERVAVIGIGRIGLCLALNLARTGHRVLGVDRDGERVAAIAGRRLASREPGVDEALHEAGEELQVTTDYARLHAFGADVVFVTVDTPTVHPAGYDHRHVDDVLTVLFRLPRAPARTELVLMCTTLPGYCDGQADAARAAGYTLSYNPVFVAQGSILRDQREPDQLLIGEADAIAGDRLQALHQRLCSRLPAVHRMDRLSAEIAKLATNCFLTTKIAFANAIGDLATRVGADAEGILAAIGADGRIGPGCLRYGDGYGGPCLPRDNRALNYYARQYELPMLIGEATTELNERHLQFQVAQALAACGEQSPVVLDGVGFKPGSDILEESQRLALAEAVAHAGRRVVIRDQPAVLQELRARYGTLFEYQAHGPR